MEKTKKLSIDNLYFHIKNIAKAITLQVKAALQNPLLLFIVIGFPILFLLGIGSLIRQISLFSAAFSIPLVLSIGVFYGYMKYSFKDSTIGKNIYLTNVSELDIFISIFFTVLIFTISQFASELGVMVIFESNGWVFSPTWTGVLQGQGYPVDIVWGNINYWMIFIFYIQSLILNVSTFFFISTFIDEYKTFSILTLVMVLFTLLFGGVLYPTWDYIDPNSGKYLLSMSQLDKVNETGDWSQVDYNASTHELKDWYSYTCFFVPQYFNNQHFFGVLTAGGDSVPTEISARLNETIPPKIILPDYFNMMFWNPYDSWWNFTLLAPYIYSVSFILFGSLIINSKNLTA